MTRESMKGMATGSLFAAILMALGIGAAKVLGMDVSQGQAEGTAIIVCTLVLAAMVLGVASAD